MKSRLGVKELVQFALLGGIMYASKVALEFLPNVHLLGVFTISLTLVYRGKALYPIYTYVMLNGLMSGFSTWWIPYLYVWTVLWGFTMLLPQNIPVKLQAYVYMLLCGVHGLLFGTLYAPVYAIMYGLSFKAAIAWIIAGLPFDIVHGISNLLAGSLILPMTILLKNIQKNIYSA